MIYIVNYNLLMMPSDYKLGDLLSINQFIYLKVKHVELVCRNRFMGYMCVCVYWFIFDQKLINLHINVILISTLKFN